MRKLSHATRGTWEAFTLIELMVVIAIIGILAALLLTAFGPANNKVRQNLARTEEKDLESAISQYYADYGRLPASTNAVQAASAEPAVGGNSNDFTFGTSGTSASPAIQTAGSAYQANNSEVIAILRDDNFPPESANGVSHIYNPQHTGYFQARIAADTNSPGIDANDVFRDPWGNPFIVTLDLSGDGNCFDAALNQMYQHNNPSPSAAFVIPGNAVVWSFGPSRTIQLNSPLNTGFNKQTVTTAY